MENHATLIIFITNNCNLKCLGCMQNCDKITDPYYITTQELINYLKILQKHKFTINGLPIATIHLTGGDPLTHPHLMEFCELIHKYLPDLYIDISTNGLLLNKFTDSQIKYLNKECKVTFQLSIYSNISLLKMYKRIAKRFNRLNAHLTFGGGSHFFFSKQEKLNTSPNIAKGYGEKCKNILANQNHVILYKNKIYSCWKDINFLQRINSQQQDNAYTLNDNTPNELMQNKKHYYCNLCKYNNGAGGEEFILWKHHSKNAQEVFNFNLKELFIHNYPLYYSLQHDCKEHLKILSDELFQKFLPKIQKQYANTRFLNGEGDIFIPFSKDISFQLKSFLNTIKDIEKYNIYFVSIKTSPEIESKVYNNFLPFNKEEKLNNYFLKANNLFNAYNTFLQNSYLPKKFIIDIEQKNLQLLPFNKI